jgi:hypothetical protein
MTEEKKKVKTMKILTIELDYDVYAAGEKERVEIETRTGTIPAQKRFYAEIIEKYYQRKNKVVKK